MLFPNKVKHRKWHRMRWNPEKLATATSSRGTTVAYGTYGAKAITPGRVNSNQIESSRRVIRRTIGKLGKLYIRIFPDRPYTEKGGEMPMGKGKGDVKGYEFEVLPGRIIFEVDNCTEAEAREAFRKAGAKLPVKVKLVARQ